MLWTWTATDPETRERVTFQSETDRDFTPATLREFLAGHFPGLDFLDFRCERTDQRRKSTHDILPRYILRGVLAAVAAELRDDDGY